MNRSELVIHLNEVLQDLQFRIEQAKTHYEELIHKHNAIHSTISTLAERDSEQD